MFDARINFAVGFGPHARGRAFVRNLFYEDFQAYQAAADQVERCRAAVARAGDRINRRCAEIALEQAQDREKRSLESARSSKRLAERVDRTLPASERILPEFRADFLS